jgi:hypothetical protein
VTGDLDKEERRLGREERQRPLGGAYEMRQQCRQGTT